MMEVVRGVLVVVSFVGVCLVVTIIGSVIFDALGRWWAPR